MIFYYNFWLFFIIVTISCLIIKTPDHRDTVILLNKNQLERLHTSSGPGSIPGSVHLVSTSDFFLERNCCSVDTCSTIPIWYRIWNVSFFRLSLLTTAFKNHSEHPIDIFIRRIIGCVKPTISAFAVPL